MASRIFLANRNTTKREPIKDMIDRWEESMLPRRELLDLVAKERKTRRELELFMVESSNWAELDRAQRRIEELENELVELQLQPEE